MREIKINKAFALYDKTQTLRKSYNFLSKVCTRREHIKINNYISNSNNNNNNNNNNNKYIEK